MFKFIKVITLSLIFVVVVALPMLTIGCGDGDDSNTEASDQSTTSEISVDTGSLSKAQFIKRADAFCKSNRSQFERRLFAYLKNVGQDTSQVGEKAQAAAAKAALETIYLPIREKQITEIGALGAPSGDEDEIVAILEAMQNGFETSKEDPLEFVQASDPDYRPFAAAEKLATAYGFDSCGQS